MVKKAVFVLVLIFILNAAAYAADGDNLTLKVAVMGPGNELYFWWGHIALIVEMTDLDEGYFFDYGIFDFDQDNFFYNFAFGRLLYCCGVSSAQRNYNLYILTNRDIKIFTLDLPPETKAKIFEFAAENVLPENKNYFYHHFNDNCSTRIRDIIDLAADGQFKEHFKKEESRFTYRQHVRRHTYFSPAADWFLNFLMGQVIDNPITVWEDMFLPSEVGARIESFEYTDINGETRKLVSSIDVLNIAKDRPPVLEKPRMQWVRQLIFSIILSVIFGFFFFLHSKNIKTGRVLAGISVSVCSLFFGFCAILLYFMNIFTNHDYTYQNLNMIFCTPLLLAAVPAGFIYAFSKNEKKRFVHEQLFRIVWLLTAAGIFISMIIKILPAFYQDNLTDQMLMLPLALLFAFQPVGLKEVINKIKIFPNSKK